jgi:hypothetical protein
LTQPEPGAEIRYTLDGSIPRNHRPALQAAHPSGQLRDRPGQSVQDGYTRSITAQETFIVGE